MKSKKSVLFLILSFLLMLVMVTGCTSHEEQEPVSYSISIDANIENGSVACDLQTAKAGETVTVTAKADPDYRLVGITVNGKAIEGSGFVMPEADVVIGATFALAAGIEKDVPAGAFQIEAQSAGGASAMGHVFLTFAESGVTFEAFVEDSTIVDKDGVAILFSKEIPFSGGLLPDGQTVKIAVNAKGVVDMYATDDAGELKAAAPEGVTTTFDTWSKNGQKLDGYHVTVCVPYKTLGTTAEAAKGAITVCPVVYSAYGALPATSASLEGVREDAQNTFAVLLDDNTVRVNNYVEMIAQLGSFGSIGQGTYWDLSKDYSPADVKNYPNREALLVGHDANDNNLVFNRVSANEMYAKATFTVIGVSDPNDQWPKFGLMLFDGQSKKGVFFYVDAFMNANGGNTLDNMIGQAVGYNMTPGPEWSAAWLGIKDDVFDLTSKSIVMEMVYQNGWLHLYANGEHVKTLYYGAYNEDLHFGIKSFGIDLKVTDYLASADAEADGWAGKKIAPPQTQDIDILFAGDSYMDFWRNSGLDNALSYTGATYVNEGVGGTKVGEWIAKAADMASLYNPSKIAFHISVNDIDDSQSVPTLVLDQLKELFEIYHELFPNATIYWNSLVPNTMFANKYADYQIVNAGVLAYAEGKEWLVYIDQTTSFDRNGAAREDAFYDGLHFNVDIGYPVWAKNMLAAMGYERIDGEVMGDVDQFAHTGLWQFNADGSAYTEGNNVASLWFKDVSGENVYAEAVINIGKLNNSDAYPKYGLLVRNANESRWGFIDCFGYPEQNNNAAGLVPRSSAIEGGNWLWGDVVWGDSTDCDHANVKLAIAKLDNTVYFLVNDVIYATTEFSGEVVVGFESFNLEATISSVVTSTDVATIKGKLGLA